MCMCNIITKLYLGGRIWKALGAIACPPGGDTIISACHTPISVHILMPSHAILSFIPDRYLLMPSPVPMPVPPAVGWRAHLPPSCPPTSSYAWVTFHSTCHTYLLYREDGKWPKPQNRNTVSIMVERKDRWSESIRPSVTRPLDNEILIIMVSC